MKHRNFILSAGMVVTVSLLTAASPFEIQRSRTEAEVVVNAAGAPFIQIDFSAELRGVIPDATRERVDFGWGTVGGVDPEPFRVVIPAGCFVARRGGFYVEDFQACRVQILFGRRLPASLSIADFEARIVRRPEGTYRLDMTASLKEQDLVPAVLGALGGASVQIAIGPAASTSPVLRAVTVSGIEPQPF